VIFSEECPISVENNVSIEHVGATGRRAEECKKHECATNIKAKQHQQ
jgi:hypothetical protein